MWQSDQFSEADSRWRGVELARAVAVAAVGPIIGDRLAGAVRTAALDARAARDHVARSEITRDALYGQPQMLDLPP
ncbi:hypothetical protein GCM10022240_31690 [Microbacterium kribbense]|uniref:DUF222 domain-containing protein n=1 Tax=Microbacterium kribbense TaxID=433645 RepID=A0ABP7H0Z6_9MICO